MLSAAARVRERVVRFDRLTILYILLFGLVVYLVAAPLGLVFFSTFKDTRNRLPFEAGVPFTLNNYANVFLDPITYQLLLNTFIFAAGSLAIGLTLSFIFAWLVERANIPWRNLIYALMIVPMAMPGMLSAIAWILLLSPRIGLLNLILRGIFGLSGEGPLNIYTLYGMFLVEGLRLVPTTFLMMLASFRSMDPALEEASHVSGAGTLATLRRITLPILSPAILAAFIYQFVGVIQAFEIPGIIGLNAGIPVFSTRIFWATHPDPGLPNYGLASTLSLIVIALAVLLVYLYSRVTRRAERFATVTGKGYRPRLIDLGPWRHLAFAGVIFYIMLAVILPAFILLWASLLPFYRPPSLELISRLSLTAYRSIFNYGAARLALGNTLIVTLVSATATMFIVSLTAWIVVRSRLRGRQILDGLVFSTHALPGIVIGLAILLMYLHLPLPIYGTIWVIVIAHIINFLAFPSRTMIAAQLQIHKELEEAAMVSGATWSRTFLHIVLPLLSPAFINGWLWVAIHAMRELSAALMLFTPGSIVISTIIWSRWDNGQIAEASALGVMLIAILAVLTFGGRVLLLKRMRRY